MSRSILIGILIAFSVGLLTSCKQQGGEQDGENKDTLEATGDSILQITVEYAEGFRVKYIPGVALISISDPQSPKESTQYHFALIQDPENYNKEEIPEGYVSIPLPTRKVVCMTTLQLSNFIALGALDNIVGISSTRHLFNTDIKALQHSGKIQKIGIEGNFDREVVMGIDPDIILISPFKRGGYDDLKEIDIPLVPHLGYKENSPLGQAEWVKFVGLLLGKEKEANAYFAQVRDEYNRWKEIASHVTHRPTVFSGDLKGGAWYVVGGKSFLAQLFHDAGADYFLKDDPNTGGVTLDFETIYSRAADVDYWRILSSFDGTFSYDALLAQDERYADFKAFKEKGVIHCNLKTTPYYESAIIHPDLLLKDFIKVFHPDLLPNYSPTYYHLMGH